MGSPSILLSVDNQKVSFESINFDSSDYDEAWLQKLLFENEALLSTGSIDEPIIPICRELKLPGTGRNVYLDILAIRPSGKPVLVECKLWRNPQARREVIGQILEYASLLRGYTYSDFQALLSSRIGASENAIFKLVSPKVDAVSESQFVDQCSRHLEDGDFDLIIAGDGIRSGLQSIKELLSRDGGIGQQLFLLEVDLRKSQDGQLLLSSQLQSKTEILKLHKDSEPSEVKPKELEQASEETSDWRKQSGIFWDAFLQQLVLDHPDQTALKRRGSFNVRAPMPSPMKLITCYRGKGSSNVGVYVTLDNTSAGYEFLEYVRPSVESEFSEAESTVFEEEAGWKDGIIFGVWTNEIDISNSSSEAAQFEYLGKTLNSLINLLRPLAAKFSE